MAIHHLQSVGSVESIRARLSIGIRGVTMLKVAPREGVSYVPESYPQDCAPVRVRVEVGCKLVGSGFQS